MWPFKKAPRVPMAKSAAIEMLGGSAIAAAEAIGVSPQAISAWPDELPRRIEDRVLAALWRRANPKPAALTFDSLVVKAGDVVILKPRHELSDEAVRKLAAECEAFSKRSGVKFFITSDADWQLLLTITPPPAREVAA